MYLQDCQHTNNSGPTKISLPAELVTSSSVIDVSLPQPCVSEHASIVVYCDQTISDGGWLVFLRRVDGAYDFPNRLWTEYRNGFGDLTGSFWLGLEYLHQLTKRPSTLGVVLQDWEDNVRFAEYEDFAISGGK